MCEGYLKATEVWPESGFSRGGELLTVVGTGIPVKGGLEDPMWCRIDGTSGEASLLGGELGAVACILPPHDPGFVVVGLKWSYDRMLSQQDAAATFSILTLPTISGAYPNTFEPTGRPALAGEGFVPGTLACFYSRANRLIRTEARWISSALVSSDSVDNHDTQGTGTWRLEVGTETTRTNEQVHVDILDGAGSVAIGGVAPAASSVAGGTAVTVTGSAFTHHVKCTFGTVHVAQTR